MGYTNKTSHYDLPQWIAGDKPSWLGDVNTAMRNIDTAIAGADASASAAESSAAAANAQVQAQEAKITKNTTDIQALTEQVATVSGVASAALPKNGGTMTGPLTLAGAPAQDLQAATKKYVDENSGKGALMLTGGTMTGPLTLSGAPTADLMAATKKYVDDAVSGGSGGVTVLTSVYTAEAGLAPSGYVIDGVLCASMLGANSEEKTSSTPILECAGNPLNLTPNTDYNCGRIIKISDASPNVTSVTVRYNGTKTVISCASIKGGYVAYVFTGKPTN